MLIEVLAFDGCPHAAGALALVRRVAADLPDEADVRLANVEKHEAAIRRFLGSPSIRIDGRDVEPHADTRRDYAFSCRLYATPSGLRPLPPERWVRDALLASRTGGEGHCDPESAPGSGLGGDGRVVGFGDRLHDREAEPDTVAG